MTSEQSIRALNQELHRRGNPEWWIDLHRVHPARQIRLPLVRSSQAEQLARAFFASISRDAELLCRRAGILYQWARGR